jgi:pyrroloquinoline-quinone synthase
MISQNVISAFDRALSGRRLLEHPYYQRWQDGSLTIDDLCAYAGQYRHIERCLPDVLSSALVALETGPARSLVEENLHDEQFRPRAHVELFEGFAVAVGAASEAPCNEATRDVVALYEEAAALGPIAALSVVGAYEVQAAEIAATKGHSLRTHYGLSPEGTEFWDVHADLESSHASWTVEALSMLDAPAATVNEFAVKSANAWWAFLDEQNSLCRSLEAEAAF